MFLINEHSRRTADICDELKERDGLVDYIRENTGLVLDAY